MVGLSNEPTTAASQTNALFGQSALRYGLVSLIAACLAYASWPLMVVLGFVMIYVAGLLALVAVAAGLLGVGAGVYYKEWPAVAAGALGLGLAGFGVFFVVQAASQF